MILFLYKFYNVNHWSIFCCKCENFGMQIRVFHHALILRDFFIEIFNTVLYHNIFKLDN